MALRKTGRTEQEAEYSVYIYHRPIKKQAAIYAWEKKNTTTDKSEAIREARQYLASKDYPKVEVKKRFFDPRHKRMIDQTLRVYEEGAEESLKPAIFLFAVAVVLMTTAMAMLLF